MASYNLVVLIGNLTRDPSLKYLPNQTPVVDFGLACNQKFKTKSGEEREDVLFVDCSAFGRTAEVINQYCQKGKPVMIEGKLKYQTWEDKQGGGKRSKHIVMVEKMQLLGTPDKGNVDRSSDQTRPQRTPSQRPAQSESSFGDQPDFTESDIPF